MTAPICRDCQHSTIAAPNASPDVASSWECKRVLLSQCPVTGRPKHQPCMYQRASLLADDCGPEGKHFSARE